MFETLVLATHNEGKVREISAVLSTVPCEIVSQKKYQVPEVEETGLTYIENALIKARHTASYTNHATLADDSGLVVPALDGAPGIYSARYAGEPVDHSKNIQKLLENMSHLKGPEARTAIFYCVLVLLRHATDPNPIIAEGRWIGHIADAPCGKNGFGYDPIFYVPEKQCCAAELLPDVKNQLSHRGQALQRLITLCKQEFTHATV